MNIVRVHSTVRPGTGRKKEEQQQQSTIKILTSHSEIRKQENHSGLVSENKYEITSELNFERMTM